MRRYGGTPPGTPTSMPDGTPLVWTRGDDAVELVIPIVRDFAMVEIALDP